MLLPRAGSDGLSDRLHLGILLLGRSICEDLVGRSPVHGAALLRARPIVVREVCVEVALHLLDGLVPLLAAHDLAFVDLGAEALQQADLLVAEFNLALGRGLLLAQQAFLFGQQVVAAPDAAHIARGG